MIKSKKIQLTGIFRLKASFLIISFFFLSQNMQADALYDASILERDGKISEALDIYKTWLSENSRDPRFTEILIYSASITESVDDSLKLLYQYENFVEKEKKQTLFLRIAQIYELTFRNYKASVYYEKASHNVNNTKNYAIYLKYLYIQFQMGNIPSLDEINNILLSNIDVQTFVDTLIFKADILKYNGEWEQAVTILQQSEYSHIYPEIQFALWELYLFNNDTGAAGLIISEMKKTFPDSIELNIMLGRIDRQIRLSDLFISGNSEPVYSYIQVGSFRNKDNLEAHSRRLSDSDFNFIYKKENNITKIIVFDSIPPGILLSKLREKGFDGFKINYQRLPE